MIFPDQTIGISERDEQWFKEHHAFADKIWAKNEKRLARLNRNYKAFHGKYSSAKAKEWTDRYKQGSTNLSKAKFKHYKLASTKLERLHGEYLLRPIRPSVEVTNKEALTEKMRNIGLQLAMQEFGPIMDQYKRDMGVDLLGGMQPVDLKDPKAVESLNPKIEYERYMTSVIQQQILRLDLVNIGAKTLLDCVIAAECHATAYILPNKKIAVERIHPRNAIFEEIENDDYLEDTSLYGHRVEMSQQDILRVYGSKLTKDQRNQIRELSLHPEVWSGGGTEYYWERNNEVIGWVERLQWKTQKEIWEKIEPGKDGEFVDYYENVLSNDYYNKNKAKLESDVEKGKYKLRKGHLTTMYESIRIGRDIFIDQRETPFIITYDDDEVVYYNQTGLLFNTVDGKRLSLQEKLEDLDELYDILMWQIRREIGKHKGSATQIDMKYFDDDVTENDVGFNLAEEGLVFVNSASETVQENPGGGTGNQAVTSYSVGSMDTLNQLLTMKMDTEKMIDRISGINEYMEGVAPVSATATQNVQAQEAGRTITSPVFKYHSIFFQNLLFRILELTKYAIGYLGDDSFDEILGEDGLSVVKKLADVHLHDFGVKLPDPNKEVDQRKRLQFWATTGINAKEMNTHIAMEADMAETIQEATKILRKGFQTLEDTKKAESEAMRKAQGENVQATNEAQKGMHEDGQQHDKDMAILEDDLEKGRMTQEGKQQAILDERNSKLNPQKPQ